ncbi:hypothetical protein MARPO_0166s0001 [Marchantia polymorpha]|uniref:Uncharacterized protein n=1 Tax=Marchantia polymorpha TaxID=3197 RepID=A0A2R6W393_MARPO|nr:hypothetical protein MARPO_0166s0001 [Marchantia polymorpha]PTQ28341.1 hypothetical protein MARPO_0166s0001 [Marchantia polymorpha]|eukprot:PTQ28340.1 hypothetical protein MARPO_0166s0001 [Marchantia polymorpha]
MIAFERVEHHYDVPSALVMALHAGRGDVIHPVQELLLGLALIFQRAAVVVSAADDDEDGRGAVGQRDLRKLWIPQSEDVLLLHYLRHLIVLRGAFVPPVALARSQSFPLSPTQGPSQCRLADSGVAAQKHFDMAPAHLRLDPQPFEPLAQLLIRLPQAFGRGLHGLARPVHDHLRHQEWIVLVRPDHGRRAQDGQNVVADVSGVQGLEPREVPDLQERGDLGQMLVLDRPARHRLHVEHLQSPQVRRFEALDESSHGPTVVPDPIVVAEIERDQRREVGRQEHAGHHLRLGFSQIAVAERERPQLGVLAQFQRPRDGCHQLLLHNVPQRQVFEARHLLGLQSSPEHVRRVGADGLRDSRVRLRLAQERDRERFERRQAPGLQQRGQRHEPPVPDGVAVHLQGLQPSQLSALHRFREHFSTCSIYGALGQTEGSQV